MKAMDVRLVGQETEVATKAKRRRFSAEYKRKIVKEADACKGNGDVGALLMLWRTPVDRVRGENAHDE